MHFENLRCNYLVKELCKMNKETFTMAMQYYSKKCPKLFLIKYPFLSMDFFLYYQTQYIKLLIDDLRGNYYFTVMKIA